MEANFILSKMVDNGVTPDLALYTLNITHWKSL